MLKNGSLGNAGTINVSGTGNALDNETVTANNALEVLAGGALLMDLGTTVANGGGTVTVDGTGTLTLNSATIDGGTITNKTNGAIDLTGSARAEERLARQCGHDQCQRHRQRAGQ